jgi:hypothetical protein
VYSLFVARDAATGIAPDAAALEVRRGEPARVRAADGAAPDEPEGPRELAFTLAFRSRLPLAFGDNWLALCADPAAVEALTEMAEELPPVARVPAADNALREALATARADTADRLKRVGEKVPLSDRARKALEALTAKE